MLIFFSIQNGSRRRYFFTSANRRVAACHVWTLFNLLRVFCNSWFHAFKLSKHVYASLLQQKIFDLNGIRGRDILEAAKENKVGAIRHFIRSDMNSVQKTDEEGTSLKDVAWTPWRFGDAMTWCNGMQWPGVVSFHFVVPCFDVKVEFLWFLL